MTCHKKGKYSAERVARVKGAFQAGLKPKEIAYILQMPHRTLLKWSSGEERKHIQPVSIIAELRAVILGKT